MIEKIRQILWRENKYRMIATLISVILFLLLILSKVLRFPENIGLCNNDGLCESFIFYGLWLPFFNSIFYFFISSFLLIFFPKNTLKLWAKIMIPTFVIFFVITIMTPDLCGGMICFDRTNVASALSKLFLILTALIVIIKSIYNLIVLRKKK